VEGGKSAEEIASQLRGRTALIYWYMIRRGGSPIGVREVQRALSLSSPSVAHHHMERLRGLGLVGKNAMGEYRVVERVNVGLLRFFVRLGRFVLPRYLFYACLMTTMLVGYVLIYRTTWSADNLMAIMLGSIAAFIFWYEAVRTSREAPF